MNIKDVVALVTGGVSGLGEATVIELVKHGAKVAIVDIDSVRGEKLAADLGANAIFIKADVTSEVRNSAGHEKDSRRLRENKCCRQLRRCCQSGKGSEQKRSPVFGRVQ